MYSSNAEILFRVKVQKVKMFIFWKIIFPSALIKFDVFEFAFHLNVIKYFWIPTNSEKLGLWFT